jgi:hypothetical protein
MSNFLNDHKGRYGVRYFVQTWCEEGYCLWHPGKTSIVFRRVRSSKPGYSWDCVQGHGMNGNIDIVAVFRMRNYQ